MKIACSPGNLPYINIMGQQSHSKLPDHMKVRLPMALKTAEGAYWTRNIVKSKKLTTVCEKAACPNLSHCWQMGTATFMIMGDVCTRRCGFCNIATARPLKLDPAEPERLSGAISDMKLRHAVITSVDRDDLADCGSDHFARCIAAVKEKNEGVVVEVLIPDFKARRENLQRIWDTHPDIINHNIETVESLFTMICPQSNYEKSLMVLRLSKQQGFQTKSGLILGLGEQPEEIKKTIQDLANTGIDLLTIGQYLQPTANHAPVKRYADLDEFEQHKNFALSIGVKYVESGPLVRSSYHAEQSWDGLKQRQVGVF